MHGLAQAVHVGWITGFTGQHWVNYLCLCFVFWHIIEVEVFEIVVQTVQSMFLYVAMHMHSHIFGFVIVLLAPFYCVFISIIDRWPHNLCHSTMGMGQQAHNLE